MKKAISLFLLCLLSTITIFAQDVKRPDSYNYNRAMDAISNDDYQEALEYLAKEVSENTQNGYAYIWIAVLRNHAEEYGRALTSVNQAIKYLPKKDAEYIGFAYKTRSVVYEGLNEMNKAIDDISTAIKYEPDNEEFYERRAQLYYEQEKYDLSDTDYNKIIELNEGGVMGYMGIGRNANMEKRYEDAIKQFDYVIKLHSDYSSGYSFRAESYLGLKKYNEAIDDVITALNIDGDDKSFELMQHIADSAYTAIVTKVKIQQLKESASSYWPYCLGVIYENHLDYTKAINAYKESMKIDPSHSTAYRIAYCYYNLGFYDQALTYSDQTIALAPEQSGYYYMKSNIQNCLGMIPEAIETADKYISMVPESLWGYNLRGLLKNLQGDLPGALEDYSTTVALNPEEAYGYLKRGIIHKTLGNEDDARRDFEQVILLDTVPDSESITQYAFLYLGQKEKAIEWQNKLLAEESDKGTYYDAACLYSLMNDKKQALSYLRQALEAGYYQFVYISQDQDLDNIRQLPEFKQLIEEFMQKQKDKQAVEQINERYIEKTAEIPFASESGVYKVKCTINDLPLHFIFDTGASDVSMSMVEASFMLKNGYLSQRDVIGKQNYMTATGEITEGTIVNLQNVSFGGLHLNNVKASIVKSQNAPLLLGQSVLNKLGVIEIDNQKKVLKITYKEKIQ
ncbi:retroviral-like aspartic protease family protein [Bacteroides sp. 519]|uniref:TPR end-of-group domain-containing protein n=1 Tax=Bacteroides sp. 519 TaxID=2302937 RepID=UPI0013D2B7C2|nr:retroviral-like aspartic protease family protein [Bacteroides sp. 519]NDV59216.1 aspartic protease [Bacteroides sp. 519]